MIYKYYLKSNHWKDTKDYLKNISKKQCYVCLRSSFLNVHHLSYKTLGYEDGAELVFLCDEHHKKLHYFGGDKRQKRPLETDWDLIKACSKLISMRMKFSKKNTTNKDDVVLNYQNYLNTKLHRGKVKTSYLNALEAQTTHQATLRLKIGLEGK